MSKNYSAVSDDIFTENVFLGKIFFLFVCLNSKNLFLTVLGAGKSKTKASEDLVFGDSLLPTSLMAIS